MMKKRQISGSWCSGMTHSPASAMQMPRMWWKKLLLYTIHSCRVDQKSLEKSVVS